MEIGSEYLKGLTEEDLKIITEAESYQYSHLLKSEMEAKIEPVRTEPKIMRNNPCICGSGKKYKKCCINSIDKTD